MRNFFDEKKTIKNVKIPRRSHANNGHACNYDIFNSFNPKLQLKYNESAFNNKQIYCLN